MNHRPRLDLGEEEKKRGKGEKDEEKNTGKKKKKPKSNLESHCIGKEQVAQSFCV